MFKILYLKLNKTMKSLIFERKSKNYRNQLFKSFCMLYFTITKVYFYRINKGKYKFD